MLTDIIHLTQGEFLLKYWYIYTCLFTLGVVIHVLRRKSKKTREVKK